MNDRNTAMRPCYECKREGAEHLVRVFVQDEALEENDVETIEDLADDELYKLQARGLVRFESVCSECGSDYVRNEDGDIID